MRAEETIKELERAEERAMNIRTFPLIGLVLGVMLACPLVSAYAIYYDIFPPTLLVVPIILIDLFDALVLMVLLHIRTSI